jgi:hypothetical protein
MGIKRVVLNITFYGKCCGLNGQKAAGLIARHCHSPVCFFVYVGMNYFRNDRRRRHTRIA